MTGKELPPMDCEEVIKRAFEVAPECGSIGELKHRLIREGYLKVNANLSGWKVRREVLSRLNSEFKDGWAGKPRTVNRTELRTGRD